MSQLMTLGKSENDMNNTIVVRTASKDYGEKKQDAHLLFTVQAPNPISKPSSDSKQFCLGHMTVSYRSEARQTTPAVRFWLHSALELRDILNVATSIL